MKTHAGEEADMVIRIESQSKLLLLRPLCYFVRHLLEQLAPTVGAEDICNNLELAFTEAYTNIHKYAYGSGTTGTVIIHIHIRPEELEFTFEDHGLGYEPCCVPPPNLDKPAEGGLGLWLMGEFMDECAYTRTPEGRNILRLIKRLPADADSS